MKKISFALFLFFSCLLVYAQVGNRHFEYSGSFSICPPRNWTMREVPGFKYKYFFGIETNGFTPNMNFVDEYYDGSLSDYVELAIIGMKRVLPDLRTTPKEYFETDNGLIGYKVIINYTFETLTVTGVQYIFSNNNLKYIVNFTVSGNTLGNFGNIFDQCAKTFQFIR